MPNLGRLPKEILLASTTPGCWSASPRRNPHELGVRIRVARKVHVLPVGRPGESPREPFQLFQPHEFTRQSAAGRNK